MKRVIYTSIFWDYDKLREPKIIESAIDYICFTDSKKLKSTIWKIIYVDQNLKEKNQNRKYKMLTHKYLSDYDESLYVDGNIKIIWSISPLFDKYLSENDIAITFHSERKCIYDEFDTCFSTKIVNLDLAMKQKNTYLSEWLPRNLWLFENNIILRRHNKPQIIKLMNDWFDEINIYTQRDQLSFMYVAWKNWLNKNITTIQESPRFKNKYFKIYPHNKWWKIKYLFNIISFRRNYNFLYKALYILKISIISLYKKIVF